MSNPTTQNKKRCEMQRGEGKSADWHLLIYKNAVSIALQVIFPDDTRVSVQQHIYLCTLKEFAHSALNWMSRLLEICDMRIITSKISMHAFSHLKAVIYGSLK